VLRKRPKGSQVNVGYGSQANGPDCVDSRRAVHLAICYAKAACTEGVKLQYEGREASTPVTAKDEL
jgi:hypothetical protein